MINLEKYTVNAGQYSSIESKCPICGGNTFGMCVDNSFYNDDLGLDSVIDGSNEYIHTTRCDICDALVRFTFVVVKVEILELGIDEDERSVDEDNCEIDNEEV